MKRQGEELMRGCLDYMLPLLLVYYYFLKFIYFNYSYRVLF